MSIIRENLPQRSENISVNNVLNSYFPTNTRSHQANIFNWDAVCGYIVKLTYRKESKFLDISEFAAACKSSFLDKLDNPDFWLYLEQIYFDNGGIYKISPEFLVFRSIKVKGDNPTVRLNAMFASLLQKTYIMNKVKIQLNFLEEYIVDVFQNSVDDQQTNLKMVKEYEYLPFLSREFQKDLLFLSRHPKYLLNVLTSFLRLYAYLYTSQLALNLGSWKAEPSSKPVYFILDTETASAERSHIQHSGHQHVDKALYKIFPYLAMSEFLQAPKERIRPIWLLAKDIEDSDYHKLKNYAEAFKEKRALKYEISDSGKVENILEDLLELGMLQFAKGQSRNSANRNVVKTISVEMCNHFVQSRGRAGKVLVLNQDYLMLLTNISIGEQDQRSFHELLVEFRKRGVFFDKKSQQVLIQFYERIGNVERMSDSGDAVYVRKTI